MKKVKATSLDAELFSRQVTSDSKLTPDEAWQKKQDLIKLRQEIYKLARARGATELSPEEKMRDEHVYFEVHRSFDIGGLSHWNFRSATGIGGVVHRLPIGSSVSSQRTSSLFVGAIFDQASNPVSDRNSAENDERFRSFAQKASNQAAARAENEWASSDLQLNLGVRKALLKIDPDAAGEVLQDLAEELIAQIVACRELDRWSTRRI